VQVLSLIDVLGDFSLSRALPTPLFNSLNLARSFPSDVAISLVCLRCDVLTITAPRTEAEIAADDNKDDLTTKKKPCIVISARVHPVIHARNQGVFIIFAP
jgi:hypothetical protein